MITASGAKGLLINWIKQIHCCVMKKRIWLFYFDFSISLFVKMSSCSYNFCFWGFQYCHNLGFEFCMFFKLTFKFSLVTISQLDFWLLKKWFFLSFLKIWVDTAHGNFEMLKGLNKLDLCGLFSQNNGFCQFVFQ